MEISAEMDVLIIGGGPAGCAAAISLTKQGINNVCLIDARDGRESRVGESVPPEIGLPLRAIGCWEDFQKQNHVPCLGATSQWGSSDSGYNDFLLNAHGPGWHLDRVRFDQLLAETAQSAGAQVIRRARASALSWDEDAWRCRVTGKDDARTVRAQFIINATGHGVSISRTQGAVRKLHDNLIVVSGFVDQQHSGDLQRLTRLEAVDLGWWYAAELPDGRQIAAIASDPEIIKSHSLTTPELWFADLLKTKSIGQLFENADCPKELLVRNALTYELDRCVGRQWLAVGDAASSFDPISSQGIHKALDTGISGGRAVAEWFAGKTASVDVYADTVKKSFQDHLGIKNYFYAAERRWHSAPFWRRRCALGSSEFATEGRLQNEQILN